MPERFKPTFKDLDKDAERHLDLFGTKGSLMGAAVVYGLDESERHVFDAYVAAGANDAIATWLMRRWNYLYGTNPYFDETIDRFCREGAAARVSRLWRHVCAEQIENYRILKAHRDLKDMNKSIAQAKERVLTSMREWRRCLVRLSDEDALLRLDEEIADFEADRRKPVGRKPDPRKIDQHLFWEIVRPGDQVLVSNSGRVSHHPERRPGDCPPALLVDEITGRLAEFSGNQIRVFDKLLWEAMQRLNHYDVWALAFLLQDSCSDDAFEAFRAWVILQGREASDLALGEPVTFLSRIDVGGNMDGSSLLHAPAIAFDRRTGKALPMAKRPPAQVQGTPWREDLVEKTYPLLASKIAARKDRL